MPLGGEPGQRNLHLEGLEARWGLVSSEEQQTEQRAKWPRNVKTRQVSQP